MTALQIWNALGRRTKLALAAREKRELDRIFGNPRSIDRVIVEAVLERCDRYAEKVRR